MLEVFRRVGCGCRLDAGEHIEGQQAEDHQQDAVAVQHFDPWLAQRDDAVASGVSACKSADAFSFPAATGAAWVVRLS